MTDKVGMIQRPKQVGDGGLCVGALLFTTLLPSCPKVMLNVESGDYAVAGERRCGCQLERMGFHRRLHEIRSFEKLNSAGVTFLGTELIALVEEVLPARFGGSPIDYQFVEEEEEEEDGLPRVSLVVSPRLADRRAGGGGHGAGRAAGLPRGRLDERRLAGRRDPAGDPARALFHGRV